MRTAYAVLLLMIFGTASSYGWELGVSGGVRDYAPLDSPYNNRPAPVLTVNWGKYLSADSDIRVDLTAAVWNTRAQYYTQSILNNYSGLSTWERQRGFSVGPRATYEFPLGHISDERTIRSLIGVGLLFVNEETGIHHHYQKTWGGEGTLGIAYPVTGSSDFVLQYGLWNRIKLNSDPWDHDEPRQTLSLGYRFAVWN